MPFRRRAFTLVELLVVVGIITVLIALLLPILDRAREHANRVQCAANLRTIGHGLTMYVQQYRYYPGCSLIVPGFGTSCAVWPARLKSMIGGDKRVFHCPSQGEQCQWTDRAPGDVMWATEYHARFGYEVGERLIVWSSHFSYGYNFWGASGTGGSLIDGTHKGLGHFVGPDPIWTKIHGELPASRVRVPAEMIAIADSTADGNYDFEILCMVPTPPDPRASAVLPGRVHGGGANVLFCDGHVQWYLQKDLLVVNPNAAATATIARMWNNDHRRENENPRGE